MLFGAASPSAFASGVWNFKLLQSVLLCLGIGLSIHLTLQFKKQLFSARAGGWLLHAGLLLVITGGVLNYFSKEKRVFELIEGQTGVVLKDARIKFDSFDAFYKPGRQFKGAAASIRVLEDGKIKKQLIHINRPGSAEGGDILLGDHGFAPRLHFRDASGNTLLYAYLSLQTEFKEKRGVLPDYRRTITIPGSEELLDLDFEPAPNGGLPTDPQLTITSHGDSGPHAARVVALGANTSVGDVNIAFEDLRYWAAFTARRDPGLPILFTGMIIVLLGSLMTFLRIMYT
jgi:hypothetical protein